MDKNEISQQAEFLLGHQHKQNKKTFLGLVMAALVAFITIYLLILPAVTMENSQLEVTASNTKVGLSEKIYTEVYAGGLMAAKRKQYLY